MKKYQGQSRVHIKTVLSLFAGLVLSLAAIEGHAELLGSPKAKIGGVLNMNLDAEPTNLNPLMPGEGYGKTVKDYLFERLLDRNIDTYEYEPAIAEKWQISKDGMEYTFTLRDGVKFHDGSVVTTEDVKFSFDVNFDTKLSDAMLKMYYASLDRAEIVDAKTIKFYVKTKYYQNFDLLAQLTIVPKHIYGDVNKKVNKAPVGTGPYMLEKYDQGQKIILKRNPNWWGAQAAHMRGQYNFDQLTFRFIKDRTAQLESVKKGDFNYLPLAPEQYEKQTDGAPWGQTVMKAQVKNDAPKGITYLGFNFRRPLFQDREIRLALAQLFNRELMIEKFFYNKYLPATGPWYRQAPDADPNVKPVKFDPAAAKEKLKKSGWVDSDKDGVLDRQVDGKKVDFRFTLLHGGGEWEKYLTIYKEDLKKSGIDAELKQIEWNAFNKAMDDRNFDMVALAWGGVIDWDAKQVWHSSSEANKGSNFISYSNPAVDKLIDDSRVELNKEKRRKMKQKLYALIANDHPYVLFANPQYAYYAYDAKIQRPKPTYRFLVGVKTWWLQ